jgi:outer membrane protein OmpA-like peptidoglycan-associated protein
MYTRIASALVGLSILAACASPSPDSIGAREFATQKEGTCCYVGYQPIPDIGTDWAKQNAELQAALSAKKSENEALARQLAATSARPTSPDLSGQLADLQARLAAKESENEALMRQLAAMRETKEKQASDLTKALAQKGSVTLRGIFFDTGKSTIKPESETDLAAIGQALNSDRSLKLEIQGHTDNIGGRASNLNLSQRRAEAVKKYVVQKYGVSEDQLSAAGYGESRPVADNATPMGRAQNRRVELVQKTEGAAVVIDKAPSQGQAAPVTLIKQ